MASYTMTLRKAISDGLLTTSDLFQDFITPDMPAADATALKDRIIYHFELRELGQETPDRFKHYFRDTVRTNIDEFNRLYKALLHEIDPFANTILSHTFNEQIADVKIEDKNKETSGSTSGSSSIAKMASTSHEISAASKSKDTPFTQVLSPDTSYMSAYDSKTETDNITLSDNTVGNTSGTDSVSANEDNTINYNRTRNVTQTDKDLAGMTEAEAFEIYRTKIITLGNLWLEWLEPCFMQIWS